MSSSSYLSVYPLKVSRGFFINYCYLIVNSLKQTAILIDPAWEKDKIEENIKHLKVKLSGILLTHAHIDHVDLAQAFAQSHAVPVYMGKTEVDYYGFTCPNLIPLETFEEFTVGQIPIQPISTPGHTYGGISYLIASSFFCGDTLFIEGCGMCLGRGADAKQLFYTLEYLKSRLSSDTLIYPGHCYGATVGKAFSYLLRNNLYLQFNCESDFIAFRMRPHQTGLFNFK